MLRVTVELIPWGMLAKSQVLSVINIANNVSGTPELGNYDIVGLVNELNPIKDEIKCFERSKGHLELVFKALKKLKERMAQDDPIVQQFKSVQGTPKRSGN